MKKPKTKKPKTKEPSRLFRAHYGDEGTPLTVYDNHDGTFAMYDNEFGYDKLKPERALRLFTGRMTSLVLRRIKLRHPDEADELGWV